MKIPDTITEEQLEDKLRKTLLEYLNELNEKYGVYNSLSELSWELLDDMESISKAADKFLKDEDKNTHECDPECPGYNDTICDND